MLETNACVLWGVRLSGTRLNVAEECESVKASSQLSFLGLLRQLGGL